MKKRSLIFDIPNIAFEIAAVNKPNPAKNRNVGTDSATLSGLCMHILFMRVQKYFRDYNPDHVVFVFENKNNWRKAYSTSDESTSKRLYKGNRTYDSSMEYYFKMLDAFRETCTHHTSIICLTAEGLEGDDMIAGYSQLYASDDHEVIIVSGDKDFIQLLKNPNVKLLNQRDGKFRNQPGDKLYWENLDYFIFEKCIRGDKNDNVFSAYPNIRATRIKKAFENEYERTSLMKETWSHEDKNGKVITYTVGDLYNENKILMDLTCQPSEVREYMFDIIKNEVNNLGKYSNFELLKFMGQFKLNKIAEEISKFQDVFIRNTQTLKGISPKQLDTIKKNNKKPEEKQSNTMNLLIF